MKKARSFYRLYEFCLPEGVKPFGRSTFTRNQRVITGMMFLATTFVLPIFMFGMIFKDNEIKLWHIVIFLILFAFSFFSLATTRCDIISIVNYLSLKKLERKPMKSGLESFLLESQYEHSRIQVGCEDRITIRHHPIVWTRVKLIFTDNTHNITSAFDISLKGVFICCERTRPRNNRLFSTVRRSVLYTEKLSAKIFESTVTHSEFSKDIVEKYHIIKKTFQD